MRLADAIFQKVAQKTDTVYYLPGGGAMFLVDALGRSGLNAVSVIHEQGAGFAAIGHAMMTGFGCCLVTSGPGVTNALTACLAAWTDSVPVLFISGQARTDAMRGDTRAKGLQYVNTVPMAKPITKSSYEPTSSALDALMALDYMIEQCTTGRRGPCWLSVPQDLQAAEV